MNIFRLHNIKVLPEMLDQCTLLTALCEGSRNEHLNERKDITCYILSN